MNKQQQNFVNHIALVLDSSSSMTSHAPALIKIADGLVEHLARRSKELDQETRITVYTFADAPTCVIYDKDVLRLPSIATVYKPHGWTALVDAALLSQEDLALTPEKYGDHSFLTFILTDGEENRSRRNGNELVKKIQSLPDHWTVAVLVPDMLSKAEAKKFGFPADNIAIWDATTAAGMAEAGETIRRSADAFMTGRATGVRGSKNLFALKTDAVTKTSVAALGLKPLKPGQFTLVPVVGAKDAKILIKDFVQNECGLTYVLGRSYYQLSKPEKVQAQKAIALVEKKTNKVYVGHDARQLLGLPDYEVKVEPAKTPDYDIFVQSTSVNRHLVVGTRLLVLS